MARFTVQMILAIVLLQLAGKVSADWWQDPPTDTPNYIYGLGEGRSLALAQQQALADISGKLSTQISASLDRVTQDTGVAFNDNVRRQISSEVNTTELSQFQLLKSHQYKNSVFALLQLDRSKMAGIWRQKLADKQAKLLPLLSTPIKSFYDWKMISLAMPDALKVRNLSLQLFALDGTKPETDIHHQLLQHVAKWPLTINVQGSKPKLTRAIQQQLAMPGLILCQSDCDLTISYQVDAQHDTLFGEYFSDTTVLFTLYERKALIANGELSAQVTSIANYQSADTGSISTIINQMQNNGFWPLFGFNE